MYCIRGRADKSKGISWQEQSLNNFLAVNVKVRRSFCTIFSMGPQSTVFNWRFVCDECSFDARGLSGDGAAAGRGRGRRRSQIWAASRQKGDTVQSAARHRQRQRRQSLLGLKERWQSCCCSLRTRSQRQLDQSGKEERRSDGKEPQRPYGQLCGFLQ